MTSINLFRIVLVDYECKSLAFMGMGVHGPEVEVACHISAHDAVSAKNEFDDLYRGDVLINYLQRVLWSVGRVVVDKNETMVVSGSYYTLLHIAVWVCIGHHFKV